MYMAVVARREQYTGVDGRDYSTIREVEVLTEFEQADLIDTVAQVYAYAIRGEELMPELVFVGKLAEILASDDSGMPVNSDDPDGAWTTPPTTVSWFSQVIDQHHRCIRAQQEVLARRERRRQGTRAIDLQVERQTYERLKKKFEGS